MAKTVTVAGKSYTVDNNGYVTNGPSGSVGLNVSSIRGYNNTTAPTPAPAAKTTTPTTSNTRTSVPTPAVNTSSNVSGANVAVKAPTVTPTQNNGTTTQVYMPGSSTPVQGTIIGGATYVNGQRVPVGAVVQTAGGYYQMTTGGGVKVSGPPATPVNSGSVVTPNPSGNTAPGYNIGTIVRTAGGDYQITGVGQDNNPNDGSQYNPNSGYWSKKAGITVPSSTSVAPANADTTPNNVNVVPNFNATNDNVVGTVANNNIDTTGSPFEGIFSNFLNWITPYIQKPTTVTPDFNSTLTTVQNQLDPLLQVQLSAMKQNKEQSKKELAENLSNRGVYNSTINDDELSRMLSEYGDQESALRANFLANVGNQAQSVYQNDLGQYNASQENYNQRMVNLGMALLNGTIDQTRFLMDDAYRNATLAKLFGDSALSNFGVIQ